MGNEREKVLTSYDYLQKGQKCEASGDFEGAIDNYTQAIIKANYHYQLYYTRACVYEKMGDVEKAADDFRTFITRSTQAKREIPQSGFRGGVEAALKSTQWNKARSTVTKVIFKKILKPFNPFEVDYSNKKIYDWKSIKIADTSEEIRKMLKEEPQEAAYRTGVKCFLQGKHKEATRHLDEAINLNPEDARPYLFRGIVHALQSREGRWFGPSPSARELSKTKAKSDFERALALSKGNVSIEQARVRVIARIFKECPYCGKTLIEYWAATNACPYCKKAL